MLRLVGDGWAPAKAAREVGVAPAELAYEIRADGEFAREMEVARDGLALVLEHELIEQATVGNVRRFYDRKTGELVREEHVPNPRLMQAAVEAHDPRYKRDAPQTNVVVIAPLSTEEFRELRAVGRDDVEALERTAELLARAEREREVRLLEAGPAA